MYTGLNANCFIQMEFTQLGHIKCEKNKQKEQNKEEEKEKKQRERKRCQLHAWHAQSK